MAAGQAVITNADITDIRPFAPMPGHIIGHGPPTGRGAPGTLYFNVSTPQPDPWA